MGFLDSLAGISNLALAPVKKVQSVVAGAGAAVEALSPLKGPASPTLFPNAASMAANSIARTGFDLAASRQTLEPWAAEQEARVATDGPYAKYQVLYTPIAPPSFLYEYACQGCRWFNPGASGVNSSCKLVQGYIAKGAYCVLWAPPPGAQPFVWPQNLLAHFRDYLEEAPNAFRYWLLEPGPGEAAAPGPGSGSREATIQEIPSPFTQEPKRQIRLDPPAQTQPQVQQAPAYQEATFSAPDPQGNVTVRDPYGSAVIEGASVVVGAGGVQRPISAESNPRGFSRRPVVPVLPVITRV